MLEQKYLVMLNEFERRRQPDIENIKLCFHILSLVAAINRDCAQLLTPYGLSEGRFTLLLLLDAAGGELVPHLLAERAGVTRATVTGLLDGLEHQSLIERSVHPQDRRGRIVRLTKTGGQLVRQVFQEHGKWTAGLLSKLSQNERLHLAGLLGKIASQVNTDDATNDPQ